MLLFREGRAEEARGLSLRELNVWLGDAHLQRTSDSQLRI